MIEQALFDKFDKGKVSAPAGEKNAADIAWNSHPVFTGVFLKHLLTAADTESRFSCHLVKIEAGCEIGEHIHEGKWEMHEVIAGNGRCTIGERNVHYATGVLTVIPGSLKHRVIADREGLLLFAKFVPALL